MPVMTFQIHSLVARETTGKLFLAERHFSLSMKSELDLILRSCSRRPLFTNKSCGHAFVKISNRQRTFMINVICLMCALGLAQFPMEEVDRLLDLANLLDEAVIHWVAAQLHVGPVRARFEPRLRDLRVPRKPKVSPH